MKRVHHDACWLAIPYTKSGAAMTRIQISLPDDLAETARDAGLLDPEAIQGMLRQQLRSRALADLQQVWRTMPRADLTPEIEQEIVDEVKRCRDEARRERQSQ